MNRRGLTLVEVVVAVALLVLLGAGLLSFVQDLGTQRARVARDADRVIAGAVLFDRLEAGLTTAMVAGPSGESAFVIEPQRAVVLCAKWRSSPTARGVCRVEVSGEAGGVVLSESGIDGRGTHTETFPGIERVRIRAHDGETWRDTFDAVGAGRLPVAVEVSLWYRRAAEPDASPTAGEDRVPDRRRIIALPDPWPGDTDDLVGGAA